MKCSVKVNDKVGGFDLTLKLNNLSAIQMSSFFKSFDYYIKFIDNNQNIFGFPEKEKELPESILKETECAFKEATTVSSNTPTKADKKAA
jgi:hypothetical protein